MYYINYINALLLIGHSIIESYINSNLKEENRIKKTKIQKEFCSKYSLDKFAIDEFGFLYNTGEKNKSTKKAPKSSLYSLKLNAAIESTEFTIVIVYSDVHENKDGIVITEKVSEEEQLSTQEVQSSAENRILCQREAFHSQKSQFSE